MKHFSIFLILSVMFFSCSKDQRAVNQLSGEWEETEWDYSISFFGTSQNEVVPPPQKRVYTFEKCKVKNGYCDGVLTVDDTQSQNFTYSVSDEGETIEFVNNDGVLLFELEKVDRKTRKMHLKDDETIQNLVQGIDELEGFDLGALGINIELTITLEKL